MKPYFETDSIQIYNADILTIKEVKDESIDLIITSPPYDVNVEYANYDDAISYADYLTFTSRWLARCYNFAKPDGKLCLNIPIDKNKGGQKSVYADITTMAKKNRLAVSHDDNMERAEHLKAYGLGLLA
jgi:site-specific DNA-methyltransferase (adenine-specific)